MRRFVGAIVSIAACLCALEARAEGVDSMLRRAQAAIERGDVDPARDLGPLVQALRGAKGDRARDLIAAVVQLGDHEGTSPAAVKAYLQREAGAALLEIAQDKAEWTVRSGALMALRTLNVPDDLLDRAIAIAAADTSKEASYFRSRAEILADWRASRPQPALGRVSDPAREARALAYLRRAGLRASQEQLADSARQAHADAVDALLDAGFSAQAVGRGGTMLNAATGLGCASAPGNVESRMRVVRALLAHGADVKAKDEVGNTVLIHGAQYCPLPVVQALVEAGADVNAVNKVGTRPLTIAFLGQNWDVAEYLVSRGARLKQADVDSVFFELPPDPRKQAIIRRATAK